MRAGLWIIILSSILVISFSGPVSAQMTSTDAESGSESAEIGVTIDGLTFQVRRLIASTDKSGYRLVYNFSETKSPGRRVSLVLPIATLIDDLGNTYASTETTGIKYCLQGDDPTTPGDCGNRYSENDRAGRILALIPDQSASGTILFSPVEGNYIEELATEASLLTLRVRLIAFEADWQTYPEIEFIVTEIEVPQ